MPAPHPLAEHFGMARFLDAAGKRIGDTYGPGVSVSVTRHEPAWGEVVVRGLSGAVDDSLLLVFLRQCWPSDELPAVSLNEWPMPLWEKLGSLTSYPTVFVGLKDGFPFGAVTDAVGELVMLFGIAAMADRDNVTAETSLSTMQPMLRLVLALLELLAFDRELARAFHAVFIDAALPWRGQDHRATLDNVIRLWPDFHRWVVHSVDHRVLERAWLAVWSRLVGAPQVQASLGESPLLVASRRELLKSVQVNEARRQFRTALYVRTIQVDSVARAIGVVEVRLSFGYDQ